MCPTPDVSSWRARSGRYINGQCLEVLDQLPWIALVDVASRTTSSTPGRRAAHPVRDRRVRATAGRGVQVGWRQGEDIPVEVRPAQYPPGGGRHRGGRDLDVAGRAGEIRDFVEPTLPALGAVLRKEGGDDRPDFAVDCSTGPSAPRNTSSVPAGTPDRSSTSTSSTSNSSHSGSPATNAPRPNRSSKTSRSASNPPCGRTSPASSGCWCGCDRIV